MPIRINLLTEALAEDDLRRRDPVKRIAFAGAFLVALSLVWYSSEWLNYKMAQNSLSQIQDQIQTHTNEFSRVQSDMKKLTDSQRRLSALQQLSTNRFLQGNLLNSLQKIYVPNVQLIRIRLDQSYTVKAAAPAKTTGDEVAKAVPSTSTEKITLFLDAKDSSSNPGDQVNRYKNSLENFDYFKTNLQTNGIRLSNLSPAQSSATKPFVMFTLECRFTDKIR